MKNLLVLAAISVPVFGNSPRENSPDRPNILWLVSEDNSAYFTACYGNPFATTPVMDKMAAEGFQYMRAYANSPVCSPARNTILTGVYAASNGNEQMRSAYPRPENNYTYPDFLRNAGYYCTNNSKEDYNFLGDWKIMWDESSRTAHYKNRPEGKPFFASFDVGNSHESVLFRPLPKEGLRHSPDKVILPPYHPDIPEMRYDWAQYYDRIEDMDTNLGRILNELEESGLADNTIVFYFGDHGGILARSKRFLYETGTHVPFIIRIPEKYKHLYPAAKPGDKVDRLISFVDLLPTLLSIVGVDIPDYIQGKAFLGNQKSGDQDYVIMTRQRTDERYEMARAVRSKKFRYIKNYMPFRITMQYVDYLFRAPSALAWKHTFEAGKTNEVQSRFFLPKPLEELYDTENDPWEINNLAGDPAYAAVLEEMRGVLNDWVIEVRDVGLIPETEYRKYMNGKPMYAYMRSDNCPFDELVKASNLATTHRKDNIKAYKEYLKNNHSGMRYWGIVGLLINKEHAKPALSAIKQAAMDESASVATLAAEILYKLGEEGLAWNAYKRILTDTVNFEMADRNFALNSIDAINGQSPEIAVIMKDLYKNAYASPKGVVRYSDFDVLMAENLLKKWGVGIE